MGKQIVFEAEITLDELITQLVEYAEEDDEPINACCEHKDFLIEISIRRLKALRTQ